MDHNLPIWIEHLTPEVLQKALQSETLRSLIKKAEKDYVYWDKFKYYPMPHGFKPEEAWAYLKFVRAGNREITPIKAKNDVHFSFTITKTMYQLLSLIDTKTSGFISSDIGKPEQKHKDWLIISGLTEEAIASSQIEGANTSRKRAKEMLLSNAKPKNKDEQMIINNFQVMQRLQEWKALDLSLEMLKEIQKNITTGTMDDIKDEGRLRKDEDDIVVNNRLTGEIAFIPPKSEIMERGLKELLKYANAEEKDEDFVHPVVKACILHFWFAYLHPFIDGNGRTARAIFHWFLLKRNYWMFQYLSISRAIKNSRKGYDNAFLYTEKDDNDLTYFLLYNLRSIDISVDTFFSEYQEKIGKDKIIERITIKLSGFNERQIGLLQYLNLNKDSQINIQIHKNKNRISYQTARTDLLELVNKELLSLVKSGKKFIFIPNTEKIKKLMENVI